MTPPALPHCTRRAVGPFALAAALLVCAPAHAQTFRLDDSASPQRRVAPKAVLDETGRPFVQAVEPQRAVLRFGRVHYRLDTREHLGQPVRLYFLRAPQALPQLGVLLQWRTPDGRQRGTLQAGERALVWAGTITQPATDMLLELDLDIDLARWQAGAGPPALRWDTHFELERATP